MICPLIALADSIIKTPTTLISACIEDNCAWWDDERQKCAVNVVAWEIYHLREAVRQASGQEQPPE
ncbi:hypothetical protein LCGC14_2132810 [marine sediment metagenome]|uniref:Uncharacterized protein n=1 Tax=marine sediment metagenome TaxID=412755 RepID=A0A0F9GWW8_9ZZZZ